MEAPDTVRKKTFRMIQRRWALTLAPLLTTLIFFQNCAEPLNMDEYTQSSVTESTDNNGPGGGGPSAPAQPIVNASYENPTTSNMNAVLTTSIPAGNPTPTLQWQKREAGATDFINIEGATSTTLRIETVRYERDHGDQYRVTAFNNLGGVASEIKTLEAVFGDNVASYEIKVEDGWKINKGQRLTTNRLSLDMQNDGNLALYSHRNGASSYLIWQAGTQGQGVRAEFNSSGLVVYNAQNFIIFAVGRNEYDYDYDGSIDDVEEPAQLHLQADGNVVIYTPYGSSSFSTNTVGK